MDLFVVLILDEQKKFMYFLFFFVKGTNPRVERRICFWHQKSKFLSLIFKLQLTEYQSVPFSADAKSNSALWTCMCSFLCRLNTLASETGPTRRDKLVSRTPAEMDAQKWWAKQTFLLLIENNWMGGQSCVPIMWHKQWEKCTRNFSFL